MAIPTSDESQELRDQFPDDITRMRRCLQSAGREISVDDIVQAWGSYSDSAGARWLPPPDEDGAMLSILLGHLPPKRAFWNVTLLDAGDGSGDAILPLPDDLIAQQGWQVGDELDFLQERPGEIAIRSVKKSG